MQLSLDEIYMKCGLKHPDVYLKDLHNSILFSGDPNLHRDIIELNRRTGKTTLIVVKMIKNALEGKSATIYTETEEDPRFVNCRIESIEITSNDTHIINNKVRINFMPRVMCDFIGRMDCGTDFYYFDI